MPAKTILIVEDEYLLALDLQEVLEECGWEVMGPAASVREALALLAQALPLVAILDVNLGCETVTPVAEFLKARGVPFALATAYPKPEQYGGNILAGAPNIGKPTDARRLLATINNLVDC